jgi:LPS export ABC transporter protein LptC
VRRLGLFAACVATIAAAGCRKAATPPRTGEQNLADSADQVIFDGSFLLTNRGVKHGELFADTMFVFEEQTRFALRRVRASFNTETGAPHGTLKGDRGTYNLRTRILEGFGNVVVTSTDGKRLLSPHLKFSESTNQISSDSAFTFYRGTDVQRGIGFTSDPNVTRFKCMRECRVTAEVPLGNITP